jgi:hypothetical protein
MNRQAGAGACASASAQNHRKDHRLAGGGAVAGF